MQNNSGTAPAVADKTELRLRISKEPYNQLTYSLGRTASIIQAFGNLNLLNPRGCQPLGNLIIT
jgi:hypothetical protein